jgi:xylose isomerase
VLDLTPIQGKQKLFYLKMENIPLGKKCGFRMQVSVVFIVFARMRKKYYRFHCRNTSDNGISMGEEEHKLGIRASSTSSFL